MGDGRKAKMKMMPATNAPVGAKTATQEAPLRSPWLIVVAAWLLPGAGHFLLGRKGRAAIIFCAVALAFLVGVLARGPLFQPSANGDILSRLIQLAGFFGDLAIGVFYFIAAGLGYAPPDQPTHTADYGSKFLVTAGLLNILAMVDAYEISTRQKD